MKECVWKIGGVKCKGDVQSMELFDAQVKVDICEAHLSEHKIVMALHKQGADMEKVFEMTHDERVEILEDDV